MTTKGLRGMTAFVGRAALAGVVAVLAGLPMFLSGNAESRQIDLPRRGMFLVASRQMKDPRFRESVVLLVHADSRGATGLIINKPSGRALSEFFPKMRKTDRRRGRLFFGGPVGMDSLVMLLRSKKPVPDATPVIQGVFITTSRSLLLDAVRRKRPGVDFRIYAGYAGWVAGQLEWEIERGEWHLVDADAATIFEDDESKVWPALLRKSEEIIVQKLPRVFSPATAGLDS